MAFWKKNDKRGKELESIKNRIEGKQAIPLPPPMPEKALPPAGKFKVTEHNAPVPAMAPKPVVKSPTPAKPKITIPSLPKNDTAEPGAPLFIKIEKYEGVIEKLDELKKTLQSLTRLISFHSEVEELKEDIFTRIKDNVSGLTDILISMDEIFVKPERPDVSDSKKKGEGEDMEEQILDLGEELRHLKRELNRIE